MVKRVLRAFALFLLPFIASLLIRVIYFTNKKNFHGPNAITGDSTIFACWHGELLMLPYAYFRYRKTPNVKALISSHFDGMLISKTMTYFGIGSIAGSTNRNATRALMQAIRTLKDGCDVGITPDGPKGPRHEVADGIVAMAQKADAKIVLVEIKPTKYWQLGSWDRFIIPKPFGVIDFYMTEPICISSLSMDEAKKMIKEGLLKHGI